ncbi:prostasin-like [Platysternon megacephalum]|uniref:Acetyl-CoA acetyltransferase n=1 Tax=Platysternon megacephalum TaxID=55544 RepID=A0A4D9DUK2_9SAUR|nr:acetyl-CoA acetyltransferase [Platysternon megacephalum]TFJ98562.1 prostasin-like [Platysternon megacephalum]
MLQIPGEKNKGSCHCHMYLMIFLYHKICLGKMSHLSFHTHPSPCLAIEFVKHFLCLIHVERYIPLAAKSEAQRQIACGCPFNVARLSGTWMCCVVRRMHMVKRRQNSLNSQEPAEGSAMIPNARTTYTGQPN